MQALINAIREDVSCCCSQHRYDNINAHLDEMQEIYNADKLYYNLMQNNSTKENHNEL